MCSYLLDAIDNISIANYQYNYIYFKKAVRIISMKLHYMSRFTYVLHLDISSLHLYFFLRTFFQKNIVVWIVIYSIGNGFVFDIVIVSRHWFTSYEVKVAYVVDEPHRLLYVQHCVLD